MDTRNRCKECGHIIDWRAMQINKSLVMALKQVYRWCIEKNKHEFVMSEIRDVIGPVAYSKFADWIYFGGILYRPEVDGKMVKGLYGLHLSRATEFFNGKYQIPRKIWKNPVTKEYKHDELVTIRELPKLIEFLDENLNYVPEYRRTLQI